VATQGRSVWIMDDLTPLHQLTVASAPASPKLFKPRDAIRARLGGGRGGGGGGGGGGAATSGQAQFPMYGATINYQLPSSSGPVTVEVLDAAGKQVRRFSSDAAAPTADAPVAALAGGEEEDAPRGRGGPPPVRLTTNAGMNRVIWDFNDGNGFMVPPGAYRVKVSAGSWNDTQPLTLRMDPRLTENGITVADLREQYDHNIVMRAMVTEVGRVANRVRQARTRLRAASGQSDSLAKVEALAVTLFGADEGVRYGRPGLQTQITYLAGMTSRVDQRIGRDAVSRHAVLRKELDALETRVNQVLGPEK